MPESHLLSELSRYRHAIQDSHKNEMKNLTLMPESHLLSELSPH